MDFLKKKMKELLDDDDKPKDKPTGKSRHLQPPQQLYLTCKQTPQVRSLPIATPTERLVVLLLVTVVSQMVTTARVRAVLHLHSSSMVSHLNNSMVSHHSSNMVSHLSSTARLKVTASLNKATVSIRATLLSITTRVLLHLKVLLRRTVLPHQCHPVGFSSGIRTASAGSKLLTLHKILNMLTQDSYVEQATGRTQWDPPSNLPPGPYAPPGPNAPYVAGAGHDERGLFGNTHGHSGHDYNTAPGAPADPYKSEKVKKDKGHSTAMLAAAGIGGVAAGAWIGHELSMCPTLI